MVQAQRFVRTSVTTLTLAVMCAVSAHAQSVREIRMVADPAGESYRFEPASVTARPGDVLLFKVVGGAPHNIVFEAGGLSPRAHEALNGALPRRAGDLSGPLLGANGAEYRVVVPALPAGKYPFFCLPHRAYDERGELVVR
jgi:plastocyanin